MIRRIRLGLVILVCVVLQTTLFTHLQIDGVAPDIGLVAVLAVAWEDGPDTGALYGFLMGLAVDLFLTTPLGLSALSFAITGYAVGVFQHGVVRTTPLLAPILGGIGGLFAGLVFITAGAIVGQSGMLSFDSLRIVIIAALYDAVIAPIVFPLVRRAAPGATTPPPTGGSGDLQNEARSARLGNRMTEPNSARRLAIVGVLVFALFAGLLTRLWFLQVTGGEKLAVAAQAQRDRFIKVPAMRGTIYDRNGTVLAQTVPVTSLTVNRQQLSSTERTTLETNLASLLHSTPADVAKLIDNTNYAAFEPVPVAKDIDQATAVYFAEHRSEFPEVSVATTTERRYPQDFQAADIVGYLGQINADELKEHAKDGYDGRDTIGKIGVEGLFESDLRGTPGKDKVEVDNQGRKVNVVPVTQPKAGDDVHLTVDLPLQHVAEESLAQGMDGARGLVDNQTGYFEANAGAVVVLDARTGAVVAMASNPSFNPNDFISGNSDQYFKDPDNPPLLNRALNPSAPGSTFKLITSLTMLQSPQLFPDGANTTYSDYPDGCFHFGSEGQKACNAGGAVLGAVNLPGALTVSSDVYFYTAGNEFWKSYHDEGHAAGKTGDLAGDDIPDAQHPVGNAIQHTARTYGLGESTGLGLGDQTGVIPDHEYRVKLNPDNKDNQIWRRGDNTSLAVGQGDVLVTPLQLANAYAAFANGGTLFQPRLADEVTQSSAGLPQGQFGTPVTKFDPKVTRTTGLTPDVRSAIESGLAGVTAQGGTAAGAFADYEGGMPVIGKTGTAERRPKQDTSWFAAITNPDSTDPAAPQYVIVAMVEQGGFGASTAAPIVRRVIDFMNNPNAELAPVVVAPAEGIEQSN